MMTPMDVLLKVALFAQDIVFTHLLLYSFFSINGEFVDHILHKLDIFFLFVSIRLLVILLFKIVLKKDDAVCPHE